MSTGTKTLVVAPAWVGDLVMAQALFMLVNRATGMPVDVVAPAWAPTLLGRMPEVASVHVLATGHGELGLNRRYQLGRRLRRVGYGAAIVLPRSLKAALVPWFARIPERTGFNSELRSGLLTDARPLDRERLSRTVDRFASLGLPPGADLTSLPNPRLQADTTNQQRLIATLSLSIAQPVIALMPGAAFGPAKMWPLEHYSDLARQLTDMGCHVWILGADAERASGDAIAAAGGANTHNLCGKTRLEDTIDLLALSAAAVSNDSGLMHIAAAVNTYVVGLFGSTPPEMTPPLTERCFVHYLALECSPCRARRCPLGHLNCLQHISPDAVRATVEQALPSSHL